MTSIIKCLPLLCIDIYICNTSSSSLRSNLSLASEDADSQEFINTPTYGSLNERSRSTASENRQSPEKPPLYKQGNLQERHGKGAQRCPAPHVGSFSSIPVLLINGEPQQDLHTHSAGPEVDLMQTALNVSNSKPISPQSESHASKSSILRPAISFKNSIWPPCHIFYGC